MSWSQTGGEQVSIWRVAARSPRNWVQIWSAMPTKDGMACCTACLVARSPIDVSGVGGAGDIEQQDEAHREEMRRDNDRLRRDNDRLGGGWESSDDPGRE